MSAPRKEFKSDALAVKTLDEFVFGRAPHPVACGRGVVCGAGTVVPEINFTLPAIDINESTWPDIRRQYVGIVEIVESVCRRAVELEVQSMS